MYEWLPPFQPNFRLIPIAPLHALVMTDYQRQHRLDRLCRLMQKISKTLEIMQFQYRIRNITRRTNIRDTILLFPCKTAGYHAILQRIREIPYSHFSTIFVSKMRVQFYIVRKTRLTIDCKRYLVAALSSNLTCPETWRQKIDLGSSANLREAHPKK